MIKSFSDGIDQLNDAIINKLTGNTSWAMLTFEKDASEPWKLHLRSNQPCYGEMRKYAVTHGVLCTQPEDRRPSDLHQPFPQGVPMALGVRFGVYNKCAIEIAKVLFNPIHSPWKNGFKKPELLFNDSIFHGVSFYDTSFDPTVCVHALKMFRAVVVYNHVSYKTYRNIGLEPYQAMVAANMMSSYIQGSPYYFYHNIGNFTARFSVRRFNDKNPKDLTGGSFRNRFDYNRKHLNYIFDDDDGINVSQSVHKLINNSTQGKIIPPSVMADAIKEVLR